MITPSPFLSPLSGGASPLSGQASWPVFSILTKQLKERYFMKQLKNMQIIGIDHGYGNLKTASGIFPASVLTFDHEPVHAQDLLVYNGKYHVIGSGHREFTPDKVSNPAHYLLTLAGIGQSSQRASRCAAASASCRARPVLQRADRSGGQCLLRQGTRRRKPVGDDSLHRPGGAGSSLCSAWRSAANAEHSHIFDSSFFHPK